MNNFDRFLHGGDYNPDQWLDHPEILEEDIRLMKLAKCNVMTIGVFAWAALEPSEGVYTFDWLRGVLDKLAENGIYAILSTPSGARPAWMSAQYPEVLRVSANRVRNLHGLRHNHCFTSPVYRRKVTEMNTRLAQAFAGHPAVLGWHISNEYGGECHCPLCQDAFRSWLKKKYGTLDKLNHAWWTAFWSHTYTDWNQIESPAPHGESGIHGMNLDWRRFVTDQTVDFCRNEIAPLKAVEPALPVTTNMMNMYDGLNYWKFREVLDVISWDSYPTWHDNLEAPGDDSRLAAKISMAHDIFRSLLGKPFLLMESTPSQTNWQPTSKLKKPGMHLLSSLQAVAHGSDSVQYFQWRKSRGASEKFHGAVVDHCGHEHTRVFQDVRTVGQALEGLGEVLGASVKAEVALIYDWENRWAIEDSQGPRNCGIHYEETVFAHYLPLWKSGVAVDVIDMEQPLDQYKLVVAPMLYMVRPGVAERMEEFVRRGGTLITSYMTGMVDENDLCFLDGFPGPLRKVLGIWAEEMDSLYDGETNGIVPIDGNPLGLQSTHPVTELCELIHLEGAQALAVYESDFYAGRPVVTRNSFGAGQAYHVAARSNDGFQLEFLSKVLSQLGISTWELPAGVSAQIRQDEQHRYVFLMNFTNQVQHVEWKQEALELLSSTTVTGPVELKGYEVKVLKVE